MEGKSWDRSAVWSLSFLTPSRLQEAAWRLPVGMLWKRLLTLAGISLEDIYIPLLM